MDPPGPLTFIHVCLVLHVALDVLAEPLIEPQVGVKQRGHDEVQQCPQLRHAVLDGRAGQQKAVTAAEPQEKLPPLAVWSQGQRRRVRDFICWVRLC